MNRLLLLLLLLSGACLCGSVHARKGSYQVLTLNQESLPLKLNTLWRYHAGDDPAWARPDFPDSNWTTSLSLFDIGNDGKDSMAQSGSGWFRVQLSVDSALVGRPLALTFVHAAMIDVFVDGARIHASDTTGQSIDQDEGMPYNPPLTFTLSSPGLHLLAIRFTDTARFSGEEESSMTGFSVAINTAQDAIRDYNRRSTLITSATVFFFSFFLAFGLIHLVLFLYHRTGRSNLYFSVFCFGLGFLFLAGYLTMSLSLKSVSTWMDSYATLIIALVCASLSALINDLFGWGRMRFRLAQIIVVAGILGLFIDVVMDYVVPFLLAAVLIEAIVLILRAIVRGVPGAGVIGAGVLFFSLTIISIAGLAMMGPEFAFTFNNALGVLMIFGAVIAIISIPLSMSAYLAWSFAGITRKLGLQLSEVERLSEAARGHEAEKQRLLETRAEELEREVSIRTEELRGQKDKSDELLRNILPDEVAEELKAKGSSAARLYNNVTVLFTDFADFTQRAETMTPEDLVHELDECFSAFDGIITRFGLEKIKTVGDAYIAVSGLPAANKRHAQDVILAALEIRAFMAARKAERPSSFHLRLGVHSGAVVAGIVGVKKFAYDIWGDTVNTAARMEQHSEAGQLNISAATYELVKSEFACSYRGELEAKHKGRMGMYFVESR